MGSGLGVKNDPGHTFLLGSTISITGLGLDPVFLLLLTATGAGLSFSSSEESRAAKKFDCGGEGCAEGEGKGG